MTKRQEQKIKMKEERKMKLLRGGAYEGGRGKGKEEEIVKTKVKAGKSRKGLKENVAEDLDDEETF